MEKRKKSILAHPYTLFVIAIIAITSFFIVFEVFKPLSTKAAPGDIAVTVNREAGLGPLEGANLEIMCTGGTFISIGATDASGLVQYSAGLTGGQGTEAQTSLIPAEASCDDSDNITFRISLSGYVTKESDGSDIYYINQDNQYSVSNVQFAVKIFATREIDSGAVSGGKIELGDKVTCLEDNSYPLTQLGVYYCPFFKKDGVDVIAPGDNNDIGGGQLPGEGQPSAPIGNMIFNSPGYVETIVAEPSGRNNNQDPQVEVNITDIPFQLKIEVADELGNRTDANILVSDSSEAIKVDNIYYFANYLEGKGISIKKPGFVDNEVTNTVLNSYFTSNKSKQAVISLGAYAKNTDGSADGSIAIKGLEFSQKISALSEADEVVPLDSVAVDIGGPQGQFSDPTPPMLCTIYDGVGYCPVPIDQDGKGKGVVISASGFVDNNSNEAIDRSADSDPQAELSVTGLQYAYKISTILAEGSHPSDITGTVETLAVGDDTGLNNCIKFVNTWFCPVTLANSDGRMVAQVIKDGYVEKSDYPLSLAGNRSNSSDDQIEDEIHNIEYITKVTVLDSNTDKPITGASVSTGAGYSINCEEDGSTGIYFCAIPRNDEEASIKFIADGYDEFISFYDKGKNLVNGQNDLTINPKATTVSNQDSVAPVTFGSSGLIITSNKKKPATNIAAVTAPQADVTAVEAKATLLEQIIKESKEISQAKPQDLPKAIGKSFSAQLESSSSGIVEKVITSSTKPEIKKANSAFITYGTESTTKLGVTERANVISGFQSTYGHAPSSTNDWEDALKIANGRWPSQTIPVLEKSAANIFNKIYSRQPDAKIAKEKNALVLMAYGVRPTKRNLISEAKAIITFVSVFKYWPSSLSDWNIMRAIAYSGVGR